MYYILIFYLIETFCIVNLSTSADLRFYLMDLIETFCIVNPKSFFLILWLFYYLIETFCIVNLSIARDIYNKKYDLIETFCIVNFLKVKILLSTIII